MDVDTNLKRITREDKINMLSKILSEEEIQIAMSAGYGENVLCHRLEDLLTKTPDGMTMEELAVYADAVTFAKVKKNDATFFRPQLQPIPPGQEVQITLTGLGNIAHIATYIENEEIKGLALQLYHQLLSSPMETVKSS
jgi:hypothetical protein